MRLIHIYILGLFLIAVSCSKEKEYPDDANVPSKGVYVVKKDNRYALIRNGLPYEIKGGCGWGYLDVLRDIGGNSLRTYNTEYLDSLLSDASKYGITISVGLFLDKVNVVDYRNEFIKKRKKKEIEWIVKRYKDHPAILSWCIGNEFQLGMDPDIEGWKFVNELSKMIHEIDPYHPTATGIAGYPRKHIPAINKYCQDLDIIFINKFKEIETVLEKRNSKLWRLDRPIIFSEIGHIGYWDPEIKTTEFGSPIEPNDTLKAQKIIELLKKAEQDNQILGAYVFFWGNKDEFTNTWFSLFGRNGEYTYTLEKLNDFWGGNCTAFQNNVPRITNFEFVSGDTGNIFQPQITGIAKLEYANEPTDSVEIMFCIYPESRMKRDQYNREIAMRKEDILFNYSKKDGLIKFKLPENEGPYRLYVSIIDEHHHHRATQNIPFEVRK